MPVKGRPSGRERAFFWGASPGHNGSIITGITITWALMDNVTITIIAHALITRMEPRAIP